MASFSWSHKGTTKKFSPVSRHWQREKAQQLRVQVQFNLDYGRDKYYDHTSAPKKVLSIKADGNCFFRAISVLVTGVEDFHQTIREQITKHVEKNSEMYRTFLESRGGMSNYVRSMRRSREWATDTEIFATATLLKTIIEVCSPSYKEGKEDSEYEWQTFRPLNDQSNSLPKVYINHRDYHFEPILDIDTHGQGQAQRRGANNLQTF